MKQKYIKVLLLGFDSSSYLKQNILLKFICQRNSINSNTVYYSVSACYSAFGSEKVLFLKINFRVEMCFGDIDDDEYLYFRLPSPFSLVL